MCKHVGFLLRQSHIVVIDPYFLFKFITFKYGIYSACTSITDQLYFLRYIFIMQLVSQKSINVSIIHNISFKITIICFIIYIQISKNTIIHSYMLCMYSYSLLYDSSSPKVLPNNARNISLASAALLPMEQEHLQHISPTRGDSNL